MASNAVAYNPDDPLQAGFLSALAQGETGGSSYAATEGVGGTNLSGYSTDQYGFPIWNGLGNSHAAGTFQFQPSTWSSVASQYDLNFQNPQDQSEGAWLLAQKTYSNATGGQSLETALSTGQFSSVQSALASIWPSVTGNASQPAGLANALGGDISTAQSSSAAGTSSNASANTATAASSSGIGGYFVRGGLILIAAVVIIVALWKLLADQGYVPSAAKIAKGIVA